LDFNKLQGFNSHVTENTMLPLERPVGECCKVQWFLSLTASRTPLWFSKFVLELESLK